MKTFRSEHTAVLTAATKIRTSKSEKRWKTVSMLTCTVAVAYCSIHHTILPHIFWVLLFCHLVCCLLDGLFLDPECTFKKSGISWKSGKCSKMNWGLLSKMIFSGNMYETKRSQSISVLFFFFLGSVWHWDYSRLLDNATLIPRYVYLSFSAKSKEMFSISLGELSLSESG